MAAGDGRVGVTGTAGTTVLGWGTAVPARRLTNADLEAIFDTSDDWIVSRTGIRERRVGPPEEVNTYRQSQK